MAILAPSKGKPDWLDEARAFCRDNGIKIAAWGPDLLTVESGSPQRAREIASQFAQLGFHVVENADDAEAGLLDLSRNPQAVQAQIASFDISHRRWGERIEPLIWAACSALFFASTFNHSLRYPPSLILMFSFVFALLFLWDALRLWTWRLELLSEGIHIRRYNRWAIIPWSRIHAIDSRPAKFGRGQVSVVVTLESHSFQKLGTFVNAFGINLRDRLRYELAQRR